MPRIIESSVYGFAEVAGTAQTTAAVSIDSPGAPFVHLSIEGLAYLAVQPRTLDTIEVGAEIYVGGRMIPLGRMTGTLTVNRSLGTHMQAAQFTLKKDEEGAGLFGESFQFFGPGTGRDPIDIVGVYRVRGETHRFPLLTGGVVNNITHGGNPQSGFTETYSIGDRAAAIDKQTVTLKLAAGSGYDRAEIIAMLAALLGITDLDLEACGRVDKIREWVDADFFRSGAALLEPTGRALLFDVRGRLANPRIGRPEGPPRYHITETDLLAGQDAPITTPCDLVTEVTLTTTQQVTAPPEQSKGRDSIFIGPTFVREAYAPAQAAYSQNGDGTLSPLPWPAAAPQVIEVSERSSVTETLDGYTVAERSTEKSWRQIEAPRYQFGLDGERSAIGGAYVGGDADPAGGDSAPAYAEIAEQWRVTKETATFHFYDAVGYQGVSSTEPWGNHFLGSIGGSLSGFKLGTISEIREFYAPRTALRERVIGQSWEDTPPRFGVKVLGGGDAVLEPEAFRVTSRVVQTLETSRDKGTLLRSKTYTYGWAAIPRSTGTFQFNSGTVAELADEAFQLIKTETVEYVKGRKISTVIDYSKGRATPVSEDEPSAPSEAVPRIKSYTPAAPDAVTANPRNTQPVKVIYVAAELEDLVPPGLMRTDAAFAESTEELEFMARHEVAVMAANDFTIPVLANFDLREGDAILYDCPQQRVFSEKLQVHEVAHAIRFGGTATTTITAKKYLSGDGGS
jgi:hypothetical protein